MQRRKTRLIPSGSEESGRKVRENEGHDLDPRDACKRVPPGEADFANAAAVAASGISPRLQPWENSTNE